MFSPSSYNIEDDCVNEVVRLRDGTSEYNGRVEVCVDGVWASICSDQWTDIEASVVCLELGFSSQGIVYI